MTKILNPEKRLDPRLVRVLERIRDEKLPKDYDAIGIINAPERGAKSTLANLMNAVVDPNYELETGNLYKQEAFREAVENSEKRKAWNNDEGASMWYRRNAMTSDNKDGVMLLTTMGQKNLFVTICTTHAELVENYLLGRIKWFIQVTKRGRFKFYRPKEIKHFKVVKVENRDKLVMPPCAFKGSFGKLTKKEYDAYEKNKFAKMRTTKEKDAMPGVKITELCKKWRVTKAAVLKWLKAGKLEGQKNPAGHWLITRESADKLMPGSINEGIAEV